MLFGGSSKQSSSPIKNKDVPYPYDRLLLGSNKNEEEAQRKDAEPKSLQDCVVVEKYHIPHVAPFPPLQVHVWHPHKTTARSKKVSKHQVVDDCAIGGTRQFLRKFCRQQERDFRWSLEHGQSHSLRWMLQGLGVLVVTAILLLHHSSKAVNQPNQEDSSHDDDHNNNQHFWRGIYLLIGAALALAWTTLGNLHTSPRQRLSQDLRNKFNKLMQQLSPELEQMGYSIQMTVKARPCSWLLGSIVQIHLRKTESKLSSNSAANNLPPVSADFALAALNFSNGEAQVVTLHELMSDTPPKVPVDDWVVGGLVLRLQTHRREASQRSWRWVCCLLGPLFVLIVWMILFHCPMMMRMQNEAVDDSTMIDINTPPQTWPLSSYFLTLGVLLGTCIIFHILYLYMTEFIDGGALRAVSRTVVKQFSTLCKERHGQTLAFETIPLSVMLPKLNQGMIRCQSESSFSENLDKNNQTSTVYDEAQIAFV